MVGYEAKVSTIVGWLSGTDENLNGMEICKINVPNISANRTIVQAGTYTGTLKWDTTTLFSGICTGGVFSADVIETNIIPRVYYTMVYKDITGTFTAVAASTILTAIGTAAGVTVAWTLSSDPTVSVRFARASCFDAAKFLADIANTDYWSTDGTNTFTVGPRGSVKGAVTIIEDTTSTRMDDGMGKINVAYVRGVTALGAYVEGVYDDGVGTKVRSWTEKKASDKATLDLLAKKYYDQLNTRDGPSSIEVNLTDMEGKYVGDWVTLSSALLGLPSASYRLSRIQRRLDGVAVSITSPNKTLEDRVLDLKKYEDFGIYAAVMTVPKGSQVWNSNIRFSVNATDPIYTVDVNGPTTPSDGTVLFDDTDTLVIDLTPTAEITIAVGVTYVYWSWPLTALQTSTDYTDCVGSTKGLLAKLTADGTGSVVIETFGCTGFNVGVLGPEFGIPSTPVGFTASNITTLVNVANDGTVSAMFVVSIPRVTTPVLAAQYACRYRIYGDTEWSGVTVVDPGSGSYAVVIIYGCVPAVDYEFQVAAISKLNMHSAWSSTVTKTAAGDGTPPGVPTGLSATGIPGGVIVKWTANAEVDLAGYYVYRNTTNSIPADPIAVVNTNFFAWAMEGSGDYIPEYFWVKAFDTSKNASAATASVNATPLPMAAIDLDIELRPWTSDLHIVFDSATPDNDAFYWGKGGALTSDATVTFSDGTTKTIDAKLIASKVTLAAGMWYFYWDDTTTLKSTADHATANGPGKGLIAIVKVEATDKAPTILMFSSYLPTISGGVITAKSIIVDNLEVAMTFTGHLIQTSVAYPKVILSDTLGIVGMKDASTVTFKIDPVTGEAYIADGHIMMNEMGIKGYSAAAGGGTLQFSLSAVDGKATAGGGSVILDSNGVRIKGTGMFTLADASNSQVAKIDMEERSGRDTLVIQTASTSHDISLEAGGYIFKLRGDGDIDVTYIMDLTDGSLILPIKTSYTPTRDGEIWIDIS